MSTWNGSTGLTATQVQAACAAAITAASLPSTAQVTTAAQTGAAAAIVSADLPSATTVNSSFASQSVNIADAANPPNTGPYIMGPFTGSTSYVLLAPVADVVQKIYGCTISSDVDVVVQFVSSTPTDITDEMTILAGDTLVIAPGSRTAITANAGLGIDLAVDDNAASLTMTMWSA